MIRFLDWQKPIRWNLKASFGQIFTALHDNPHLISLGVSLKIPPVDGILYEWKEGDKLDHIAGLYKVDVQDILLYPGNDLDITNPVIEPGTFIMIPGGYRELEQSWIVPLQPAECFRWNNSKNQWPWFMYAGRCLLRQRRFWLACALSWHRFPAMITGLAIRRLTPNVL